MKINRDRGRGRGRGRDADGDIDGSDWKISEWIEKIELILMF